MNGELLQMVKTHYDAVSRGDLDAAVAVFDPNVEPLDPNGPIPDAAAFRAYGEAFKAAFPDGAMTMTSWIESGDTIAVEGIFAGTHTGPLALPAGEIPPTGRPLTPPFADVFRAENGHFVTHHVYYDRITFMTQLGLMPEAPAGSVRPT